MLTFLEVRSVEFDRGKIRNESTHGKDFVCAIGPTATTYVEVFDHGATSFISSIGEPYMKRLPPQSDYAC